MFTTPYYLFLMHKQNIKDIQLLSLLFENINSHHEPISHFESSRRQNRTLLAAIVSINVSLTRLTAVPLAHTSPFRIPVQSTSSNEDTTLTLRNFSHFPIPISAPSLGSRCLFFSAPRPPMTGRVNSTSTSPRSLPPPRNG